MNQHKSIARRLLPLALAALFCSLFFTLIQCQITIGSKQQELAAVREQLSAQQAQNEELGRALADGKDAIIERSARADGYAKPNERIWVDLSASNSITPDYHARYNGRCKRLASVFCGLNQPLTVQALPARHTSGI